MPEPITVGYSQNDFFYVDAVNNGLMPSDVACTTLQPYHATWDVSCNNQHFETYKTECVNKELCINSNKVYEINENENKHGSADKAHIDSTLKYDMALMDIINLGIGIMFAIVIIYRNRNIS